LVPRTSSTPVAAWSWPTWVVSQRRVLEAAFIMLEPLSPSRRIFIGSIHSPLLWFAISVLHSLNWRSPTLGSPVDQHFPHWVLLGSQGPSAPPPQDLGRRSIVAACGHGVDGVFWYTKHVHYTLIRICVWN
jgi:hypothetical protein